MEERANKILYIGLSRHWSSRERSIIRDVQLAKEVGRKSFLFCHEHSFLGKEAKKKGIDVIYYKEAFSFKFLGQNIFSSLPEIIKKRNIDLVHFYDVSSMRTLSYLLYRLIGIPLILTQYNEVKYFYTNLFYRFFSRRVDLVIVHLRSLREHMGLHLKIHERKIYYCGLAPLKTEGRGEERDSSRGGSLFMGVHLSGAEKEDTSVRILFRALAVFNRKMNREVRLKLVSETPWEDHAFYENYRELAWEYQIGDRITFNDVEDVFAFQKRLDLWAALVTEDDLEDYVLSASLQKIPFLAPRTGPTMDLLYSHGRIGESYKERDGREFWQKGLKILQNLEVYGEFLNKAQETLWSAHNRDSYKEKLFDLYDTSKGRRWAYTMRKRRTF